MYFLNFADMKTKEQVIRYLSRRSYDDADWQAILQKCHFLYGSGVRKALRPKQHSTYQDFIDWLECGIGDGAVVKYENIPDCSVTMEIIPVSCWPIMQTMERLL